MLARVAENIYWLSRYLERAENTVRLIEKHSAMLLDVSDRQEHGDWIPLVRINALDKEFAETHSTATESSVCHFLLADEDNPGSLHNIFIAIRNNLRSCRDILPRSSYEATNSTCRFVRDNVSHTTNASQRNAFLSSVKTRLLAISADIDSNMYHDIAFRFMGIGRSIERADMTSRIIDVQSSKLAYDREAADENLALQQQRWVTVLGSLSALQMYRQNVHRPINGQDTLRFLLHNTKLPRSYLFCINELDSSLSEFNNHRVPRAATDAMRQQLLNVDLAVLADQPVQLHQFIDTLQMGMQNVAKAIADTYFLSQKDT